MSKTNPSVFDLLSSEGPEGSDDSLHSQRQAIFAAQEKENPKELSVDAREMSLMLEYFKSRNSDLTVELALAEARYALAVQYIKSLEDRLTFLHTQSAKTMSEVEKAAKELNDRETVLDSTVNPALDRAIKENVTH